MNNAKEGPISVLFHGYGGVLQLIASYLSSDDLKHFFLTCKTFHSLYTAKQRLRLLYADRIAAIRESIPKDCDMTNRCPSCGLLCKPDRYLSHKASCKATPNWYMSTLSTCRICEKQDSLQIMQPWNNKLHNFGHPFIGCDICGKPATADSKGCIHCCAFRCRDTLCPSCGDFIGCGNHMCKNPDMFWTSKLRQRGRFNQFVIKHTHIVSSTLPLPPNTHVIIATGYPVENQTEKTRMCILLVETYTDQVYEAAHTILNGNTDITRVVVGHLYSNVCDDDSIIYSIKK